MALQARKTPGKKSDPSEEHGPVAHEEESPPAEDGEGWLVSYADMMTLLCGFFIMLFTMSKMEEPKYEGFKEAVAAHFGGQYKSPSKEMFKFVTQVLQDAGVDKPLVVEADSSGVSVAFESELFFDSVNATIQAAGKAVLDKLAASVFDMQLREGVEYNVVVEGHTDSRPVTGGNYPSNWELSSARSSAVVRLFADHGFQGDKLTAIGYASTRPKVPERKTDGTYDEEAQKKNRRVVVRVLMPKVESVPFSYNESGARGPGLVRPVQPGSHALQKFETGLIPAATGVVSERKPAATTAVYGPPEPPKAAPAKSAH